MTAYERILAACSVYSVIDREEQALRIAAVVAEAKKKAKETA